jgi:hypothetical protein
MVGCVVRPLAPRGAHGLREFDKGGNTKMTVEISGVPPVTITTRMLGSPANSCRLSVSASPISASKYMRFALPKVITAIPSVTLVDKTSAFIEGSLRFNVFRRICRSAVRRIWRVAVTSLASSN